MIILSVVCGLFVISGCGNSANQSKDSNANDSTQSKYADKVFLEDFKQGLYDRWDYADSKESDKDYYSNLATYYKELANKELNNIKKYKNANFKDAQLHEYAISYINNLEKSKTLKFKDYVTFDNSGDDVTDYKSYGAEAYGNIYNKRIILIKNIVNEYNVAIKSSYKKNIDDIINNAKIADEKQQEIDAVNNIFKNVTFTKNPNTENEYTAIVENNTNNTFKNVFCEYRLLSDNTVVGEEYVTVEEWAPHQKYTITIQPTVNFNKTELLDCFYEIKQ